LAQAQVDNLAAELTQLRHLVRKYAGMATHEVVVLTPSVGPLIGATLKSTTNPGLIPAGAVAADRQHRSGMDHGSREPGVPQDFKAGPLGLRS